MGSCFQDYLLGVPDPILRNHAVLIREADYVTRSVLNAQVALSEMFLSFPSIGLTGYSEIIWRVRSDESSTIIIS